MVVLLAFDVFHLLILSFHLYHITSLPRIPGLFRYLPSPHIQHIYPTVVSVTGGALVRLYGAYFQPSLANYTCVFTTSTTTTTTTPTTTATSSSTATMTPTTTTPTTTSITVPAICHSSTLITCRAPPAPIIPPGNGSIASPGPGSIRLYEQYLGEILPLGAAGVSGVSATIPGGVATGTSTTGTVGVTSAGVTGASNVAVGVVASPSTSSSSFVYQFNPIIDTILLHTDPYSSLPYLLITMNNQSRSLSTSTAGASTPTTPTSAGTSTPTSAGASTPTTPTSWMCEVDGIRRAALVVAENTVVCSVTEVLFDGGYKTLVITGK